MASLSKVAVVVVLLLVVVNNTTVVAASWCVARSDASEQALQTALDYACGAGADCAPVLSSGLCYLPNTIQAHASYAYNSYFQRKSMAPGSCDFSGTATVASTDPSYGSCIYPSSPSTAGGMLGGTGAGTGTGTPTTTPILNAPPPPWGTTPISGSGAMTPALLNPQNSKASWGFSIATILLPVSLFLVSSLIFQPI
ncbi:hypothetical protein RJ639_015529 [Escallonia herrerae]|uniref:X8 domain-containing protein n=1 Tax=Escallonia herrerae TaxID=1293975 RepID=A0AA88VGI1_9ASTE|nr:hypothetical protein RJ639_015529 [Escallonia herrerae]